MPPTKKIMVYPTRQIDYAHILKIPITKTQHSRQHMLNISDRQSRGGSTGGGGGGGGGGHRPPKCGHKKKYLGMCPPPPPAALAYKPDRQHMPTKPNVSDRQHMLTKPMYQRGSTCLQNPTYSDRLKMTNTSQKPNIQGKLTMRTDLKCQHITRA